MPNELNIALATTGLTVTCQPYQAGAAVGSALSCPETGSTGFYSGNMTGSAGTYQLAFRAAGANVGSGSIIWDGTNEIAPSTLTAAQVNAEADTALADVGLTSTVTGRIDAAISSRLAPSGTLATVTTLTNAPTVPSASAIASQVRSELSVELARVDQNISSRLAAADYNAPTSAPTAASVANAVWSAATKEITGGTVTTLTNAPSVPTPSEIASQVRSELSVELGRVDQSISSRLAAADYTAPTTPPTAAQIATAVEGSLLNEADGQAVLNAIVGAIGNQNLSEVSLVAAVRADLERSGGKIDSIPTTSAPTAAANATAVWSAATKTITGGTVDTLTNSPSVPSAASIASATRTELTTELGRLDAAVSTRLATSGYTAPSTAPTAAANASAVRSELTVELAKVAALNTDRLANVATTNIVGTLLAQANS